MQRHSYLKKTFFLSSFEFFLSMQRVEVVEYIGLFATDFCCKLNYCSAPRYMRYHVLIVSDHVFIFCTVYFATDVCNGYPLQNPNFQLEKLFIFLKQNWFSNGFATDLQRATIPLQIRCKFLFATDRCNGPIRCNYCNGIATVLQQFSATSLQRKNFATDVRWEIFCNGHPWVIL